MLKLKNFELHDNIYFPCFSDKGVDAIQKQKWNAVAQGWQASFEGGMIFERLACSTHFEVILDMGCGDGRRACFISRDKNITCSTYVGIDISENMLRRLLEYKKEFNFFPSAQFFLFCSSIEDLPFEDNSVDFIMSDSVLIHLNRGQVKKVLTEMARVIKPQGKFILHNSFYNKYCPAHNIKSLFKKLFSYLRGGYFNQSQFSLQEIHRLLKACGVLVKYPCYTVSSAGYAMFFPEAIFGRQLPLVEVVNKKIAKVSILKGITEASYSVYNI